MNADLIRLEKRVFLSPPHLGPCERELVLDAFDSNWVAPLGPHVDAFEREVAAHSGMSSAVALSSGTAAIHLALRLLGIGPDDEVWCPSFTFVASVNPALYEGATPVFLDSELATWNLDPNLLSEELARAAKRGKLPKAVVIVNLYGQCADWNPILEACSRYEIPLVEDSAEAMGAVYEGKRAGSFGKYGIFSFNGNKIITTSGGGMLISNDDEAMEQARFLASQARDVDVPYQQYQHTKIGYNYRLSNILAAIGRGQLGLLDDRIKCRKRNFERYRTRLADLPGLEMMPISAKGEPNYWLTCLLIDPVQFGASNVDVLNALADANIESRLLWKPMHLQPLFKDCRSVGGDVCGGLFEKGLCLPSGSNLEDFEAELIIEIIRDLAKNI